MELRPWYTEAYDILGGAFVLQGRLDEAVVQYQKALRLGSRSFRFADRPRADPGQAGALRSRRSPSCGRRSGAIARIPRPTTSLARSWSTWVASERRPPNSRRSSGSAPMTLKPEASLQWREPRSPLVRPDQHDLEQRPGELASSRVGRRWVHGAEVLTARRRAATIWSICASLNSGNIGSDRTSSAARSE